MEIRDLDDNVLATCCADSTGQWSAALPGCTQWFQIFYMEMDAGLPFPA